MTDISKLNKNDLDKIYKIGRPFTSRGMLRGDKIFGTIEESNLPPSVQNLIVVSDFLFGDNQSLWVYRGFWVSGLTYYKNDLVSHNDKLWLCIVDETTEEPSEPSDDWRLITEAASSINIEGWGHTLEFTAGTNNTVSWSAGTVVLGDGTTYNINSGTTGAVSQATYIYLDTDVSLTDLQVSTTKSDGLGSGQIIIGIANLNVTTGNSTFFDLTGNDTLIEGGSILASSITVNEMAANSINTSQLTVGCVSADKIDFTTWNMDDIYDGSVYAKVLKTSISAGKIILSETEGVLGDIPNGGGYRKTSSTNVNASGIVILSACEGDLDDIDDGTYSKVLSTEVSAGHIKITGVDGLTTVIDGGKIQTSSLTADEIDVDNLFAQTITATGTITGGTLQTSSSGQRVVFGSDKITFYDSIGGSLGLYGFTGKLLVDGDFESYGDVFCEKLYTAIISPWGEGVTTVRVTVPLKCSEIREYTSGGGVTIDGLLIKDGDISPSGYWDGSFINGDGDTVTVSNGRITDVS